MMPQIRSRALDFLVLGGGIVGISIALEAKRRHPGAAVGLLEKGEQLASHASGRNSGVLHSGLYYAPGSLKAQFTVAGNRRLTEYCLEHGLRLNRCGKLVVAREAREQTVLEDLERRARAAGARAEIVDEAEAADLEPSAIVRGRALFAPDTSSVDPLQVVASLAQDAVAAGVTIERGTSFVDRHEDGVLTDRGVRRAGYVINAAGAHADRVAHRHGLARNYRVLPFRGEYLRSRVAAPVRRHVYPVPDLRFPFLGTHLTVDTDGSLRVGPTAMPALGREHYRLPDLRAPEAAATTVRLARVLLGGTGGALRRLALRELRGYPAQAMLKAARALARGLPPLSSWSRDRPGIRAQLIDLRTMTLVDDFAFERDIRSFHVLNAVSPGFTCALPFAEHVMDLIEAGM